MLLLSLAAVAFSRCVSLEGVRGPSPQVYSSDSAIESEPAVSCCGFPPCVSPQAIIVYLVREVQTWVQGRGLPSDAVYCKGRQGPCRGWQSHTGAPVSPYKAGMGVCAARRGEGDVDFVFAELQLPNARATDRCQMTADVLFGDEALRSSSLSFSQLKEAVRASMKGLRAGGRESEQRPLPDAVETALKEGDIGVALASFAAVCCQDMAEALSRPPQRDAFHSATQHPSHSAGS